MFLPLDGFQFIFCYVTVKTISVLLVIRLENEHPRWNSDPVNLNSKISQHKVTMLMFSQELIWRGEICYTNIVVFEYEKWRYASWELMYFIAFSFGHALVAIKADHDSHEAAEHFVCHRGPSTKDSETEIVVFVCWLTPKYTLLLLTHFRKTKYADWLRSIFWCFLLVTFGKVTRWQ